jgi:hypothetical protein
VVSDSDKDKFPQNGEVTSSLYQVAMGEVTDNETRALREITSGLPVIRDLTRNTCTVRLRSPSSLDEPLDKIRNDQSTSAIQMNAVRMETPVIDSGDFVRALAQHQSSESIAVE